MHDSLCVYVSTIYSCVILLLLGSVTNYVYPLSLPVASEVAISVVT